MDERLYLFLYGGDAVTWLTRVMIALSWLGSGWLALLLVPMLVRARTRRFAATLAVVLIVQAIVVWAMKRVVQRTRPFAALGTRPSVVVPTDFSFPSGHAAGSFAVAGFVVAFCVGTPALRGRVAIASATVVLAVGIALSRVFLGLHYPGDVAGGALLGGALGFVAGRWYCANRPNAKYA